jgi:hypothetical protein
VLITNTLLFVKKSNLSEVLIVHYLRKGLSEIAKCLPVRRHTCLSGGIKVAPQVDLPGGLTEGTKLKGRYGIIYLMQGCRLTCMKYIIPK